MSVILTVCFYKFSSFYHSGSLTRQGSFIWWNSSNRFMILIAITKMLVLLNLQQNILLSEIAYSMPNLTCCCLPGTLLLSGESKNSILHKWSLFCVLIFQMSQVFFLVLCLNDLAPFAFEFHVIFTPFLRLYSQGLKLINSHTLKGVFGIPDQLRCWLELSFVYHTCSQCWYDFCLYGCRNVMLRVNAKQGAPKDGSSPLELFQVIIFLGFVELYFIVYMKKNS